MRKYVHDSFRKRISGSRCVYCGEPASTDEHFPPAVHMVSGFILPACDECNKFASDKYPTDFMGRARYVKDTIRKRYKKFLKARPVSDEEIAELGPSLASALRAANRVCLILKDRLSWDALAYIASIDHDGVFA